MGSKDIPNRYVEVSGCVSGYFDSGQSAAVTLSSIVNMGWVKDSSTFTYELYAI